MALSGAAWASMSLPAKRVSSPWTRLSRSPDAMLTPGVGQVQDLAHGGVFADVHEHYFALVDEGGRLRRRGFGVARGADQEALADLGSGGFAQGDGDAAHGHGFEHASALVQDVGVVEDARLRPRSLATFMPRRALPTRMRACSPGVRRNWAPSRLWG